tara:strand:+ start:21159 stop:21440 length:282 start_codon:yes stop_codon:yes gene_type:complete
MAKPVIVSKTSGASFISADMNKSGNYTCCIADTTPVKSAIGNIGGRTWYYVELIDKPELGPIADFDINNHATRTSHYKNSETGEPMESIWIVG